MDTERVEDLITNAFEGGSNYWYRIVRYEYPDGKGRNDFEFPHIQLPLAGGVVVVDVPEDDDGKEYRLDAAAVQRGLKSLHDKYPRHYADWLAENDDAITGDMFLQCCLFGEEVYA